MGEKKRKERQVLITKALLLGYTIERNTWYSVRGCEEINGFKLVLPNGMPLMNFGGAAPGHYYEVFAAPWLAAKKALELAGVLSDAKNTR